jgi:hypothetical protein
VPLLRNACHHTPPPLRLLPQQILCKLASLDMPCRSFPLPGDGKSQHACQRSGRTDSPIVPILLSSNRNLHRHSLMQRARRARRRPPVSQKSGSSPIADSQLASARRMCLKPGPNSALRLTREPLSYRVHISRRSRCLTLSWSLAVLAQEPGADRSSKAEHGSILVSRES